MDIPFKLVVEEQEAENYAPLVPEEDLLILPHKNKGLVVTRNWIWNYAQSLGVKFFWTFDDNIRVFIRLHKNQRIWLTSGNFLRAQEDFAERWKNLAITGMQYRGFAPSTQYRKPFIINTRVYSNMLIRTAIPFRNRGFYNDDTDLCLQVLKAGWCTILISAFLIGKAATMTVRGGMTPHYQDDGRLEMAQELQRRHPDVVTIIKRWKRWQHHVNYKPFKRNKLERDESYEYDKGVNNFGLSFQRVGGFDNADKDEVLVEGLGR